MPGLTPLKAVAGVNPTPGGGADTEGGPGRAMALASVAPRAIALGSCTGSQAAFSEASMRQFKCESNSVGCTNLMASKNLKHRIFVQVAYKDFQFTDFTEV